LGSDNQNDGQKFKQNVKTLDDVRNRSDTVAQRDRQTDRNGMSAVCCAADAL